MDDSGLSCEPMDIDMSSHSTSAMDISYIEGNIEVPISIKKEMDEDLIVDEKNILIKPIEMDKLTPIRNESNFKSILKFLTCIIIILFSVVTYQIVYFKCNQNLDINLLRKTFASKVYGQTIAISTLLKALEAEEANKIIIMYGGTGVGKTYTLSLMLESILKYGNIYHYTMPGFSQTSSNLMLGQIYCESSVIVVDDLSKNDILTVKEHIKELIIKSIKYSKKLTIIMVLNCDGDQFFRKCDDTFLHKLKQSLTTIKAYQYFIKFGPLTKDVLRQCIKSALTYKKLNEIDIVEIMKNFNVTSDGCKGVYQKMKYLSII